MLDENMFKRKLQDTTAIERTDAVFEVEVTDPRAEVVFFHKGEEVKQNETCTVEKLGKGVFRLTFKNASVAEDEGDIKVKRELSSFDVCSLNVLVR